MGGRDHERRLGTPERGELVLDGPDERAIDRHEVERDPREASRAGL